MTAAEPQVRRPTEYSSGTGTALLTNEGDDLPQQLLDFSAAV